MVPLGRSLRCPRKVVNAEGWIGAMCRARYWIPTEGSARLLVNGKASNMGIISDTTRK